MTKKIRKIDTVDTEEIRQQGRMTNAEYLTKLMHLYFLLRQR